MLVGSTTARADDPALSPPARSHFAAGQRAYDAHDYATASNEFAATYELDHQPVLLYSWAQAERLGAHCTSAIALYHRFLASPGISSASSELARHWLAVCEDQLPTPWYRDKLLVGLAAGGLVGIGVGTAFLVDSSGTADEATHAPTLDAHDVLLHDATRQREIGGVMLTLGLVAATAAVAVFVGRHTGVSDVVVATNGRGALVGARF